MVTSLDLQLILLLWRLGAVNSLSVIKFCVNAGAQYGAIVIASAAGNFSDIGPKILLEPVFGLDTGYQFIKAAQTVTERRTRIAILATFFSTSVDAIGTDPATNNAAGGMISFKISYMQAILVRRGRTHKIAKLNFSSKNYVIVIDNMFQEHTS